MSIVKVFSVDEFEMLRHLPENQGRLLELIDGRVMEKAPTEEHGVLALRIGSYLVTFMDEHEVDGYAGVEVRHQMPHDPYNSRLPDVSYRRADTPLVTQGAVDRMPDLAIEVQSPDDTRDELRKKAEYYLSKGARLVWLFFPKPREVEACTLDDAGVMQIETIDENGALDAGDVLPGFKLPVKKIFR